MMDLRTHLERARLANVTREVDCAHELPAVLAALESAGRHEAVRFCSVRDNTGAPGGFPVVANLFADVQALRSVLADAGMADTAAFNARVARDGDWQTVPTGPVKDHVYTGQAIDLRRLPIVTHHERDAGPYLTSGIVVARDPETGTYNAAIQRLSLQAPAQLGIFMVPTGHNKLIHEKYRALGRAMPVAVVVGHHPLFYLGAQTKEPMERDEYRIISSLMSDELRLTPATTLPDFLIPADAEIVIEGFIPPDELRPEGPFAEYTHYYSGQDRREYIAVSALCHRQGAELMDIFACHRDHHLLEGTLMTAQLVAMLQRQHPEVVRVFLPPSGCCQLYCYLALRRGCGAAAAAIGMSVLKTQEYIKYVIVVDDDIDVENEAEVLWAVATRATLSADLRLFRDPAGTQMDPTVKGAEGPERGVLDATAKDAAALANRVRIHPELMQRVRVEDYLQ